MKKVIALTLAAFMLLGMLAGCASSTPTNTASIQSADSAAEPAKAEASSGLRMCMITDAAGLGDNGFNDMAWSGMERARDDFGYEIGIIESTEAAQYAANISAAADQGYNVIVCVGYLLEDALREVAPQYLDVSFMMIDGSVDGSNIYSFKYRMQESSFLAGALTALVQPESDLFGCVGGMEIPDVIAWISGFTSGIRAINPDAEVLVSYVGSFADPGKAKELALAQYNQGATAVMEITSGGSIGVIEAAEETGNKFIAVDKSKEDLAPGFELTAAIASRDAAVYTAAQEIKDGTAEAGTATLTMKDGVFGLPDYTEEKYGADIAQKIETLKQMIIDGQIVVPNTIEEARAFAAVALS